MLTFRNMTRKNLRRRHLHLPAQRPRGAPRRAAMLLMAAGTLALAAGSVVASTFYSQTARERLRAAELVVEGVVTKVAHRNSDVLAEGQVSLPHTFVTYSIQRVIKGSSATGNSITLRMQGGPDGEGRHLVVSEVPEFRPGDRDILFIHRNGSSICPLVGWQQGRIRVIRGQVYNDFGQELWVSPAGQIIPGEARIDVESDSYPLLAKATDQEESRNQFTPPQGAVRPDAQGLAAYLDQMLLDLAARGELAQVEPVPSMSINVPFSVQSLLPAAPPALPESAAAAEPFQGESDPAEAELIRQERSAQK